MKQKKKRNKSCAGIALDEERNSEARACAEANRRALILFAIGVLLGLVVGVSLGIRISKRQALRNGLVLERKMEEADEEELELKLKLNVAEV